MNDKKQIEEMAQDIASNCPDLVENCCGSKACYVCIAEGLVKDNYRKIDKDSVVLTREDYNKLCNVVEMIGKETLLQTRKETAKEILKWLVGNYHLFNKTYEIGFEKPRTSYLVLNDEIEELAKQYGVEIKE